MNLKAKLHKLDNGYVLMVDNIMSATDKDELSKENCDILFQEHCYHCQNGCPACSGYGWVWSQETEIDVEIKIVEGKEKYQNSELTWYNAQKDEKGYIILKRAK